MVLFQYPFDVFRFDLPQCIRTHVTPVFRSIMDCSEMIWAVLCFTRNDLFLKQIPNRSLFSGINISFG